VNTNAEVLSLRTEKEVDDNKVFGIGFRTPPADSTGIAHILEHSVLCGSRKYTSKEPFVTLLKGSLQTFLNAMTYPDRTVYPVASRNTKDFYNLVNVYLDAVLFPRAASDDRVLAQEGWHYELESAEDPLVYKGVVYNEMKGVYSQPESLLYRLIQSSLFPNNTYSLDSGGDPNNIPDLTFDDFKSFHSKFYHPSNSRVFFYGDDDESERLRLLDEYFSAVKDNSRDYSAGSAISWQPLSEISLPDVTGHYPVSADATSEEDEGKIYTTRNWVLNDERLSTFDEMSIFVLDHILMGTSASILYKALIDTGLGSDVVGGGYGGELQQATYSVGMKGVKTDEDAEMVHSAIEECLGDVASGSLSENAIAASLNTIEFRVREFNTGGNPKGLLLMLSTMSKWNYGNDPIAALRFEKDLERIKAEASPEFFANIVKTFLLTNKHRVRVDLLPSETMESDMIEAETEKLRVVKDAMSESDIEKVIRETKELQALQAAEDAEEDKATIPRITIEDIERDEQYPLREVERIDGASRLVTHPAVASNGILYVDVCVDMTPLDLERDVPLLPLFADLMTQTGTSKMDRVEFSQYRGMTTGGVGVSMFALPSYDSTNVVPDVDVTAPFLVVRGKSTADRADDLFAILESVLTDANFADRTRVIELLSETVAHDSAAILGSGHAYALNRTNADASVSNYFSEITNGITSFHTAKALLKKARDDEGWKELEAQLLAMRDALLKKRRDGFVISLTGDGEIVNVSKDRVKPFLDRVVKDAGTESIPQTWKRQSVGESNREGFAVPTQINFVGKSAQLYKTGEKVPGAVAVVCNILRTGYLWENIRVMGGAYGAMVRFDRSTGRLSFVSYRDPNLGGTIDVYNSAGEALQDYIASMTQEDLELAVIGTIGGLDKPKSPDAQGFGSLIDMLSGRTKESREVLREEIISVKKEDLLEVARRIKEAFAESSSSNSHIAVVGSRAAFEGEESHRLDAVDLL